MACVAADGTFFFFLFILFLLPHVLPPAREALLKCFFGDEENCQVQREVSPSESPRRLIKDICLLGRAQGFTREKKKKGCGGVGPVGGCFCQALLSLAVSRVFISTLPPLHPLTRTTSILHSSPRTPCHVSDDLAGVKADVSTAPLFVFPSLLALSAREPCRLRKLPTPRTQIHTEREKETCSPDFSLSATAARPQFWQEGCKHRAKPSAASPCFVFRGRPRQSEP